MIQKKLTVLEKNILVPSKKIFLDTPYIIKRTYCTNK